MSEEKPLYSSDNLGFDFKIKAENDVPNQVVIVTDAFGFFRADSNELVGQGCE